ncbi:SGNH/GDSL hydrolase family protein [Bailinhaonella thermotolerans]|uniref:SGNH/GDSL hydrolase family protein n=1 Tax=Bailinhaonella thermotolerans TaxID=1070861 RepID=A0A3A4AAG9_9ACTN|nr:SGNH/GDSL hydrolase family protein [Bailinhaonella thermotolerans]
MAPLLLPQAVRVRRATPRLPEAGGPRAGLTPPPPYGGAAPLTPYGGASGQGGGAGLGPYGGPGGAARLAVVGESTAAGVGVETSEEGLPGHLARALAGALGRPVAWSVAGRTGANAAEVTRDLAPGVGAADVVVVAVGVNDLLELTRLGAWAARVRGLAGVLRERSGGAPVVFSGMPPVGRFPALPRPLRDVLGRRAAALDLVMAHALAGVPGAVHAPMEVPVELPGFFASDGFHPSAPGYRTWAGVLLPAVLTALGEPAPLA